MPIRSVVTSFNKSINDITILTNYIHGCTNLDAKHQYIISEVIMLRLFSILESTISETAFKLACGAQYRNGNNPIILLRCNSHQNAQANMLAFNRPRAKSYLQWTKASFIRANIEHVLDTNDKFYQVIQINSNIINEMRIVRNHIAHRSSSTKLEYLSLLRIRYGANPNLTLGAFLISTTRNRIANIEYYITSTRVILNDITLG